MKKTIFLVLTLMMTISAVSQTPVLGGELSNSAATSVADINEVLPRMKAIGLKYLHAQKMEVRCHHVVLPAHANHIRIRIISIKHGIDIRTVPLVTPQILDRFLRFSTG